LKFTFQCHNHAFTLQRLSRRQMQETQQTLPFHLVNPDQRLRPTPLQCLRIQLEQRQYWILRLVLQQE